MATAALLPRGEWSGSSRLWLDPAQPPEECDIRLSIEPAGGSRLLLVRYSWSFRGEAQEGAITVAVAAAPGENGMAWMDSFHTSGKLEVLTAAEPMDGALCARYAYTAAPDPVWSWRVELHTKGGVPRLFMVNIAPDRAEYPAVEATFAPAG